MHIARLNKAVSCVEAYEEVNIPVTAYYTNNGEENDSLISIMKDITKDQLLAASTQDVPVFVKHGDSCAIINYILSKKDDKIMTYKSLVSAMEENIPNNTSVDLVDKALNYLQIKVTLTFVTRLFTYIYFFIRF